MHFIRVKRRNSRNLTFEDMARYHSFLENIDEAIRLREQTKNTYVKAWLELFITNTNEDLTSWLDEEV